MNKRILVAYATYAGSTAEVAAAVGEQLTSHGFSVDVRPIKEGLQVEAYVAVLIGSAVQYGTWLPEAVNFVKANQNVLNLRPVALFSVHIRNTANDAQSRQERLAYLDEVRPLLQAIDEGFFSGKFDRRGAALLLPGLFSRFMPPLDMRNWKKIRAWADNVSTLLLDTVKTSEVLSL